MPHGKKAKKSAVVMQPAIRGPLSAPADELRQGVFVYNDPDIKPEAVRSAEEDDSCGVTMWKAEILEVRQSGPNYFLEVQWFYHFEDIQHLLPDQERLVLSRTTCSIDLFASQHRTIISAASVVRLMSIRPFNPNELLAEWQTHTQWVCRYQLDAERKIQPSIFVAESRECPCGNGYNPFNDHQIYCSNCGLWFHSGCLTRVENHQAQPPSPDIIAKICLATLERGYSGTYSANTPEEETKDWLVVGWARLQAYARQKLGHSLPRKWQEDILAADQKAVSSGWPRYEPERREEFAKKLIGYIEGRDVHLGFM
ncbi:hypothetical protein C8R45DRAFT_1104794 [Mycena sanguinolenta]|nr:hypothetical protein C8R45DRAFT_1104794 [Mycena sanguinolenta]